MQHRLTRTQRARRRMTRGITLVELAVAILVLTIGTLAALQATNQSQRAIGGETPRLLAQIAARNRAEELQLLGARASLPSRVTLGPYYFTLTVQNETTEAGLVQSTVTARSNSGEGAQLVVYLAQGFGR
ncbi:type IV pilus modification PilV family protein [Pelagimonas varians]|nr:prepilin-type N-terminal cleavage/methylation domain-containing protein [Pelagimonas varians]